MGGGMIKRFNQIKNVGAFRDFSNGGSIQFEKLTFVYGLNTRGKTTLADILCSLRDHNPTLITDRASIPEVTSAQTVTISVRPEDSVAEESCRFRNGNWTQSNSHANLYVFGSEFIHRNLFTGLSVQRQNKENLTQFILGQEGVQLATQIAEDKRLLRQKRGAITSLLPLHVQNKSHEEIQAFLDIDQNEINIEQSKADLARLQEKYEQEQQRLEKPAEVLSIPDFPELTLPEYTLDSLATRTSALLEKQYHEISADALEHIKSHVENNFEIRENAERWIKEGLDVKKDETDNCVFCGQLLSNATELIQAYHSYFNEAYREFISDISNIINQLNEGWQKTSFNSIGRIIGSQSLLMRYKEVIDSSDFNELVSTFTELADLELEQKLNKSLNSISALIVEYFNEKEKKPHESYPSPDFSEIYEISSTYFEKLKELIEIVNQIRLALQKFKDSYRDQTEISARTEKIKTHIDDLNRLIARVEQNEQCSSYLEALEELDTIGQRISANEDLLSRNQSQYLDDFYESIDSHFQLFGSENFKLERATDNRGHQPVYYLKVKYRGLNVDESNLKNVFSESDKRALALSIFWAKIDLMDSETKNKAIIVLDDPITSFDDNRIGLSLNIIKETLRSVRQIVILTHYSHFIRLFCEKSMNDNFTPSFIEIGQNSLTSFLKKINKDQFVETAYENTFIKIQSFINRESDEDIRMILRPFLESQYIPHFYIDKLREAKCNGIPCRTLNQKINAIFVGNNEVKNRFHGFRKSLNPDSHIFTSANEEDVRGFARDMMSYLYDFKYT